VGELATLSSTPLFTRFVVTRRAAIQPTSWAACPRRGAASIAECQGCPLLRGFAPHGRGAALTCATVAAEPPLRASCASTGTAVMHRIARDVYCVTPDTPLDVVAELLAATGLDEVPVVDPGGIPIGVIGRADLAGDLDPRPDREDVALAITFLEGDEPLLRARVVAGVMRPVTVTLHYRASVATAAAVLAARAASRGLVVDDQGALCGVVTTDDVARWQIAGRHALIGAG
jgi:CBS domain-containing protein